MYQGKGEVVLQGLKATPGKKPYCQFISIIIYREKEAVCKAGSQIQILKYDLKIGIKGLDLILLSSWRRPHSTAGGHVQSPPDDWLKITRPSPPSHRGKKKMSFVQGYRDPRMQRQVSLMIDTERWALRYWSMKFACQLDVHTLNEL